MRSLENTPIDRLAQKVAKSRIGRVVIPALMIAGGASACATPSQEIKPTTTISTPTAEPVYTPIAIGDSLPAGCQDDPNAVKGWEINADKQHQLTAADNPSTKALNECVAKENIPGEATATVIAATKPTTTPTTAPTAESTKAPTQEAKKDEPCNIVPIKYCEQADFIIQQTPTGQTAKMIGIKVPAGEPLALPIDGQVAKTQLDSNVVFYKGYRAEIFDPKNPQRRYVLSGDFQPDNMLSLNMNRGEVFGKTQNTGVEMLGYNLIFYVADIGPNRQEVDNEEEMRRLFPAAFAKPAIQAATLESKQKGGGTINISSFYGNPSK